MPSYCRNYRASFEIESTFMIRFIRYRQMDGRTEKKYKCKKAFLLKCHAHNGILICIFLIIIISKKKHSKCQTNLFLINITFIKHN